MSSRFSRADRRWQAVLAPQRFIRWIYVARLSIATAIFIAALFGWTSAEPERTRLAALTFVGALFFTGVSAFWTEVRQKPLTEGFRYTQLIVDLLVVTSVVHLTDGERSGFAALYILVNAGAALLFPMGGALLIALLGIVFYLADAITVSNGLPELYFWLQLGVFSAVAIITAYISARLREAGQGTERLAAELQSVRLREKDILANIRSGIITVDDAGALLFANALASEIVGFDLEPQIGRPVLGAVRETASVLAEAIALAIESHSPVTRTEGIVERNGRRFPLGVTTTSSDGDGMHVPRTTTAIFQDISDQKRLEQLNLRAQRLEAVAELSASLAHEIKNPLASIRSAVEQMSRRPAANEDERTLGNLIVRESDRLSRLLSEFLDFARVRVTRRERVDIGAVVRGAAAIAAQHPDGASGAALAVTLPDQPLTVLGDDDLLHRAFFNLVLNALQATRPDTTVRVAVSGAAPAQVPRGVRFATGAVAIEVVDEGPGIPDEVADRLFEPFTTSKPGGTGLGLAITHRAIEAHKGIVLVDSGPQGTRMTVFLPLAAADGVSN